MIKISLVVITYNEAQNIERCLQSARSLVEEILVVDSFSEDDTVEIAKNLGAKVIQHPFAGYREQRAYSIGQAKYDHVLVLDADEALSPGLVKSIAKVKESWNHDCYFVNRMSSMGDRWIRHGGWYPDRKMRLFDRNFYQSAGLNPHEKLVPKPGARVKHIPEDILHYTNTSIEDRISTINRFSSIAAQALWEKGRKGNLLRVLFKPALRFFIEFIWKFGFLDGFLGFVIAKTSAQYVFYREIKLFTYEKNNKT